MVQFFKSSADPRNLAKNQLGEALGQGLGKGIATYQANQALQNVLNDESLKSAPISARMGALHSALFKYGDTGKEVFQNHLQTEMQAQQEQEQEILGKAIKGKELTDREIGRISPENQLKLREIEGRKVFAKNVHDSLIAAGYPEETASLWQNQTENATTGGLTDIIRNVNDLLKRSKQGKGIQEGQEKTTIKPSIQIPGIEEQSFDLDFPDAPEPIGLTPADTVKQNEHREKSNVPVYTETVDRLNALDDEYREVKHLQELNEIPGALPTGIEKWNVDWESGDLRVKALATPEAQDYVKTIARMARRAKDFFPGRVTNFDLDQFKQGFPTLANSPEGRKIIAEQLALGNRIAYLKDETLKAAYDHYGSNADPIFVKQQATANYRKLKGQLEDQLKSVNSRADSFVREKDKQPVPVEQANSLEDLFQ